jgi:hypothetical protein
MQSHIWKQWKTGSTFSLYAKCGAIFLLIMLSILVVACGGGTGTSTTNLGSPAATVTIQIGGNNGSPTPSLPGYWCGAWVTNTTPVYNAEGKIAVYAKFTQNLNGNPVGVGGATATAHVMWSTGNIETYIATTTSDGLAVFPVPIANKAYAVYTVTLVTVTFQKAGVPDCMVNQDRAAFFTLIHVTPTATKKPGQQNG